ncbi:MAG: hypothetical protein ACYDC6_14840 [Acidobacteriaceae bacterium]
MPGWNAAWLRLAAISYNVLTALKRIALPAELLRARPKRLRLATLEERIALWKKALPAAAGCQSLRERRLRHADRRIFLGRFWPAKEELCLEATLEGLTSDRRRRPAAVAGRIRCGNSCRRSKSPSQQPLPNLIDGLGTVPRIHRRVQL